MLAIMPILAKFRKAIAMDTVKLIVNKELADVIPTPVEILPEEDTKIEDEKGNWSADGHDPQKQQLDALRESIKKDGVTCPIIYWKETGAILDGVKRFKIANELGLMTGVDYKITPISLPDLQAAKRQRWKLNVTTVRQLNDFLRARAVIEHFSDDVKSLKKKAKENQKKGGQGKFVHPENKVDVLKYLADLARVSRSRMAQVQAVLKDSKALLQKEQLTQEMHDNLMRGLEQGVSKIKTVYDDIKGGKNRKSKEPLPPIPPSKTLLKKYKSGELNTVVNGDVMKNLKLMKESDVSRFVFSPPYYAAKKDYGNNATPWQTWTKYCEWYTECLEEMWRIIPTGGWIAINIDNTTNSETGEHYAHTDLTRSVLLKHQECRYSGEIIWYKQNIAGKKNATGSDLNPHIRPTHEYVLFFQKGKADKKNCGCPLMAGKELSQLSLSNWNINDSISDQRWTEDSYWNINTRSDRGTKKRHRHPAIFPHELALRMILFGGHVNDIVCDPFTGIGTTIEMAAALGLRWIGIEQNGEWADCAYNNAIEAMKWREEQLGKSGEAA